MKIVLINALFLFAMSAQGAWIEVSETDSATHFIDSSSVRKLDNIRLVWELQNIKVKKRPVFWWQERTLVAIFWTRPKEALFGPPLRDLSYRYRSEYDCENSTWRISFYSAHSKAMAGGAILRQVDTDYGWSYISPNTPAMRILKKVCRK